MFGFGGVVHCLLFMHLVGKSMGYWGYLYIFSIDEIWSWESLQVYVVRSIGSVVGHGDGVCLICIKSVLWWNHYQGKDN